MQRQHWTEDSYPSNCGITVQATEAKAEAFLPVEALLGWGLQISKPWLLETVKPV